MTLAFPTLEGGAQFAFFETSVSYDWGTVRDEVESGQALTRARLSVPARTFHWNAGILMEVDRDMIEGFLRDHQGQNVSFTIVDASGFLPSPYIAPDLSQDTLAGGPGATYYVKFSYSDGTSETRPCKLENSLLVTAGNGLIVTSPVFPRGVSQAKIYVGTVTNQEKYSGRIYTSRGTWSQDVATTTVNADSASGQPILLVASTTGFQVGNTVRIDSSGDPRDEVGVISAIGAGPASLTMEDNLTYTHLAADADPVATEVGIGAALPTANDLTETVTVKVKDMYVSIRRSANVFRLQLSMIEQL